MIRTIALMCVVAAGACVGQVSAVATQVGVGCNPPGSGTLTLGALPPPVLGTSFVFLFSSAFGGTIHVFWAFGPATAGVNPGLAAGCLVFLDPVSLQSLYLMGFEPLVTFGTPGGFSASSAIGVPNDPALAGLTVTTQAIFLPAGSPTPPGLSNAVQLTLGS